MTRMIVNESKSKRAKEHDSMTVVAGLAETCEQNRGLGPQFACHVG